MPPISDSRSPVPTPASAGTEPAGAQAPTGSATELKPSSSGGTRRRGGRPKKGPGAGLTVAVLTRLREDEAARVRADAEAAGLSVSAYVRRRLFGRPVAPRVLAQSVDTAQLELARVGTNLNQLVRRAHQTAADLERSEPPVGAASGAADGSPSATAREAWATIAAEARAVIGEVRAASRALAEAAEGGGTGYVRGTAAAAPTESAESSDPGSR